eukprot:gene36779-45373_t
MQSLADRVPNLTKLNLNPSRSITDEGIQTLCEKCVSLTDLDFASLSDIDLHNSILVGEPLRVEEHLKVVKLAAGDLTELGSKVDDWNDRVSAMSVKIKASEDNFSFAPNEKLSCEAIQSVLSEAHNSLTFLDLSRLSKIEESELLSFFDK